MPSIANAPSKYSNKIETFSSNDKMQLTINWDWIVFLCSRFRDCPNINCCSRKWYRSWVRIWRKTVWNCRLLRAVRLRNVYKNCWTLSTNRWTSMTLLNVMRYFVELPNHTNLYRIFNLLNATSNTYIDGSSAARKIPKSWRIQCIWCGVATQISR